MPKFSVTLEMNEVSVCTIEVEAADEDAAEARAISVAKKDYRANAAGTLELPWEVLDRETEFFGENIEELEEEDKQDKKRPVKRKSRAEKAKPKRVSAQIIQFPGGLVKAGKD